MNESYPSKRRSGRLAFVFSCLLHVAAGTLIFFAIRRVAVEQWPSMGPRAASMSVMQIALQPAAASSAKPAPPPPAPKPVEVPLEEIQKPPEPEPQPEPAVTKPAETSEAPVSTEAQTAQTAQSASAPGAQIEASETLPGSGTVREINWRMLAIAKLRALVEHEKFYPLSAQKAGYTGEFMVLIRLEPDGTISGCEIKERRGHPLLGKAVEATLDKIRGRSLGMTLPARLDVQLPIEYELR